MPNATRCWRRTAWISISPLRIGRRRKGSLRRSLLISSAASSGARLRARRTHRPQTDARPQMAVRQLRRIADMRAGRVDAQDRFRDRLKVGAEMHRRFEAEDRHLRRLDADMSEHFLVVRLDAL